MLVENELLLEAVALINSQEDQIEQIETDDFITTDCSFCGYGKG